MMKVDEMMEKLNTENLGLHGDLVAEMTPHAQVLLDTVWLQREMRMTDYEKKENARLLPAKKTKRQNSAVVKQLEKNVLTATMKAVKQIGILAVSIEQAEKGVGELRAA